MSNQGSKKIFSSLYTKPHMPIPIKNKVFRRILIAAGYIILLLLPVYCLYFTECLNYADGERLWKFFINRMPLIPFDLMILYGIWICFLCVFKKGWLGTILYGGFFAMISSVNYLKHAMTGDYFYPWDIQQIGNLGELSHFITVSFPTEFLVLFAVIALLAVVVFLSGAEIPLRWPIRFCIPIFIIAFSLFSVSSTEKAISLLNKHTLYFENAALQSSNYSANGFIGAFTVNILSMNVEKPENYTKDIITAFIREKESIPATDSFSSPDIILILSESFWDPTVLPNTVFSEDPLPCYHALSKQNNIITGDFYTSAFGGGTSRPEFEILTGLSSDFLPAGCVPWQYIKRDTESYVSEYKEIGYTTIAVHPYNAGFYYRDKTYGFIGIDQLHFEDDIYALKNKIEVTISGKQISDDSFCSALEYYLEQNDSTPVFLFGISMENHQPYIDKFDKPTITVTNDAFDDEINNNIRNYTTGLREADQCLKRLVEYVNNRDKETVLVWFGDHLPSLGANFGAYAKSGFIDPANLDSEKIFQTPFLVYSNFEFNPSTILHPGPDNEVSSYNLMNGVAQCIGAPRSEYMQILEDYYKVMPYYNKHLNKEFTDESFKYNEVQKIITYDRTVGEHYSEKN